MADVDGVDGYRERALAQGWSDELADRVTAIRPDPGMVDDWLRTGWPDAAGVEAWVADQERLMNGTLKLRLATWADNGVVADLYANSPETVGDWEVTVEHEPFAFAAMRLQENASIGLLEDRRIGLGCMARSIRNAYVGGEETSIGWLGGWRVRTGERGKGYSRMLQMAAGPANSPFGLYSYWYVRDGNAGASWVQSVVDDFEDRPEEFSMETQGLRATVHHVRPDPTDAALAPGVTFRQVELGDLDRCCDLINRTNHGLDLVTPATVDRLRRRLDNPNWGPKPPFWDTTYGWEQYWVAERDGGIVACAGLWDRGANQREVWQHTETGQRHVVDATAVLDHAYDPTHRDALVALFGRFRATTAELGRGSMMLAVEHDAELVADLQAWSPTPESRALHVLPFAMPGMENQDLVVTRPQTDLAYW